jgi:hypothetical protein
MGALAEKPGQESHKVLSNLENMEKSGNFIDLKNISTFAV